MTVKPTYWIECEYCGEPVECLRHKYGGRTRKKYCGRKCAESMEKLRKAEREANGSDK